jgi:hypothetical protein
VPHRDLHAPGFGGLRGPSGRCAATVLLAAGCALPGMVRPCKAQQPPGAPQPGTAPAIPAVRRPVAPAPAPPVNMVVEVGYQELARRDRVTRVRVTLINSREPVSARLQLRASGRRRSISQEVALPPLARKEYVFHVPLAPDAASATGASGQLVLAAGRKVLARQDLQPRYTRARRVVISATGDGTGLQLLNPEEVTVTLPNQREYEAVHLSIPELPNEWAGYLAADTVVVTGRAWMQMSAEQRRALRMWIEAGGVAVLSGESLTEWADEDGRSLLPVIPRGAVARRALPELAEWGGSAPPLMAGAVLAVRGQPRAGTRVLLGPVEAPLAVTGPAVAGTVLWFAFEPLRGPFRDWESLVPFWQRALNEVHRATTPAPAPRLWQAGDALAAARALPRLPVPPVGGIAAFGVVYAVVFGPLNIWVLRRLRRTVRAWLFMPALALVMTLVALFGGQRWGGARTVVNEISLVRTQSGSRTAYEESLVGLFSPTNRAFDLSVADSAPGLTYRAGDLPAQAAAEGISPGWPTRVDDTGLTWEQVPLQLFSLLVLAQSRPRDLGGSISLDGPAPATVLRAGLTGTVRNSTQLPLSDVYLAQGRRYAAVGRVGAGAAVRVLPGAWRDTMPRPLSADGAPAEHFENRLYRERFYTLWNEARARLAPPAAREDLWLIGVCEGYQGGLRVAEAPFNNRRALVMVRLPGGR